MKYYVKWVCMGKVAESENADIIRGEIGAQLAHIEKSGKLKDGGAILGKGGGGYFIFDIDKPAELLGLLGRVFWENFEVEIHPVVSFKDMGEYMMKEYKLAA